VLVQHAVDLFKDANSYDRSMIPKMKKDERSFLIPGIPGAEAMWRESQP
jgi:hypothetical protein